MIRTRCAVAATALVIAAASCGAPTETPPVAPTRTLALEGRAERGLPVTIDVLRDGIVVTPTALAVTVQPADAATVSGRSLTLRRSGPITIIAVADGETISLATTVAAPPVIYFDAVDAGNRDIYGVALDGLDLVRMTTSPGDDAQPSAAHGAIVFSSLRDGNAELYTVAVSGGGERRITSTSTVNERLPSLSADGRWIAFVKDSARGTRVWRTMDLGATAAAVTPAGIGTAGSIETSPAWTPSMDRLVYVSTATPSGSAGVFVAPAAGGMPVLVPGSGSLGAEVEPAPSPDGTRVVLVSSRGSANGLYVRDVATGAATTLLEGSAAVGQPAWLADGRVVFVRYTAAGSTLSWVDPSAPLALHDVATGALGNPLHPTPYRP